MPVTAIRPHRRQADRVEVDVDGETFVVAPEFIIRAGLKAGSALDDRLRRELEEESAIVRAFDRGLLLLSHRARARAELARRLTRAGFAPGAVDAAIGRLARLGYLDDESFARQFARSRVLASGQSRHRIRSELLRRGVDRATADEAIDATLAAEDVDEGAVIERVAEKKWRSLEKLDPLIARRRLYAFLARRGFEIEDIRRVVDVLAKGARS